MIKQKIILIRITTIPVSLKTLLKGQQYFMSRYFEVIGVSSSGIDLQNIKQNENIRVASIQMMRTISLFKDLKSLWDLYKLFKKEKPHIIHTHTPKAGTLGMIAAWLCRVPVRMHTVAGLPLLETQGPKRKLLNLVERITYACATKVYPNSYGLRDIIIQNKFCKPEKLHVIGNGSSNGIDTKHFAKESVNSEDFTKLRTEFNITSDDFVFIFVGRLVKDKGINELVNAFKELIRTYPSTKLILVGNYEADLDPLKPETLKEIEENKSIVFAGYQSDVRPYLSISEALVFPSYREGFPNVPMQALAMEIPAIVTDINGCNEIVLHEHNGLIIPPKNTQAIVDAMERLMNDHALYNLLKSNTRESIVSRYDQLKLWKLIKEEYDEQLRIAGIT